jgi:hypothetical protein
VIFSGRFVIRHFSITDELRVWDRRRCADQGGFHAAVDTGQDRCANHAGAQAHGDLAELSR